MSARLAGKVALITGAASGIGAATARRFAREGAAVLVVDIDEAGARALADEIAAAGGTAWPFLADVGEPSFAEAMVDEAFARFGRLDVLHNNAAFGEFAPTHELSLESWERTLAVNLTGPFLACKRALPRMVAQKSGVILSTASVAALVAEDSLAAYCTTKAGVVAFTRSIAVEYAPHGIRANAICPGTIATGKMGANLAKRPELRRRMEAAHPVGRLGTAEEVAGLAAYLASDEAAFITGATYVIDGGGTATRGLRLVGD
jgi:meso-butanediol dehydrogenase / (S,S)-butanediol dehydrogenase / diacetyl reductase